MIHVKKVRPEYFELLRRGVKCFELRKLDPNEPNYATGDYLGLNEWKDGRYTGRCLLFEIVYILEDAFSCGTLKEGCVALGLRLMPLSFEDLQGVSRMKASDSCLDKSGGGGVK